MKKNKLRVGLLLDNYEVSEWSLKMFENIISSDFAEVVLVILNDNPRSVAVNKSLFAKLKSNYGRITEILFRKVFDLIYRKLIERKPTLRNAFSETNCQDLLAEISTLKVKTNQKKWSEYFFNEDIEKIKEHKIDILVRSGFKILRGDILKSAKYGIWSFHHGDNFVNRGGPAGFWESMQSWPTTGSILQILTEDLDNGSVLYRSLSCTYTLSVTDNRSNYYWKSLNFMTRKMQELYNLGVTEFFARVKYQNRHPVFYSERLYVEPSCSELFMLTCKKLKEKIQILYDNKFYLTQWILMFHLKKEFSSSLWRYKKMIPPIDRFWADPHIIYKDNKYYIFIEEFIYSTQKGHVSLIIMDQDGVYSKPEIIIDKPYHLSYPFAFEHEHEHEHEYYMIPESAANKTIELYKCTEFPHKWEFQMNLMENVSAVDATVIYYKNKWWMFTNIIETEGSSSWDELFLFSSDNLLSKNWQAHPLNPVVSNCKSSRPAGKIFIENGVLYRPSQNCSTRYGYGFNLCEITSLDENNYSEVVVSTVNPNWDKDIIGTHTFNRTYNLHIIDAIRRRRR